MEPTLPSGSFEGIGDAGDLLKQGSPVWMLWLFGACTIPAGLRLWHGLAPKFGLGPTATPIGWPAACTSLPATVIAEALFSTR